MRKAQFHPFSEERWKEAEGGDSSSPSSTSKAASGVLPLIVGSLVQVRYGFSGANPAQDHVEGMI